MSKKSGIYKITNKQNGKIYIGSSLNIYQRFYMHKNHLNKNNHHSSHLQRAWDKYGKENFIFEIIEEVPDKNMLLEREQHYMDTAKSYERENGYNINPTATSRLGAKHTEETKRKMSESQKESGRWKGKKNPMYGVSLIGPDHGMYGKMHSPESREKISENHHDVSGANNPKAKLDWEKVDFIRAAYKNKIHTVKELMKLFCAGQSTIYNVLYEKTWKRE
tara:strand:+ start:492 stop:1151 length:660 start_codon:yes stop_codon:yes gene_type:complete